jgi:hypothetical protein
MEAFPETGQEGGFSMGRFAPVEWSHDGIYYFYYVDQMVTY